EMDNMDKLRENVGAALDKTKLTRAELEEVWRYAAATRGIACDGCEHLCNTAAGAPVQIGTTLRFLMYHDIYGKTDLARALFRNVPPEARRLEAADLRAAGPACPHRLDLEHFMRR